jgi:hypothetical protein
VIAVTGPVGADAMDVHTGAPAERSAGIRGGQEDGALDSRARETVVQVPHRESARRELHQQDGAAW